jgi:hypothetical protein
MGVHACLLFILHDSIYCARRKFRKSIRFIGKVSGRADIPRAVGREARRKMSDKELLAAYMRCLPRSWAATPKERTAGDLDALYADLPEGTPRLPRLYERLLLSYSWHAADFGGCDLYAGRHSHGDYPLGYNLLGNPPGKTPFAPLLRYMRRDPALWEALAPARLIPFGKGGMQHYDPVCLDLSRMRGRDCPVVGIDHEDILCFHRVRVAVEFAPTFRELVERTVRDARAGAEK